MWNVPDHLPLLDAADVAAAADDDDNDKLVQLSQLLALFSPYFAVTHSHVDAINQRKTRDVTPMTSAMTSRKTTLSTKSPIISHLVAMTTTPQQSDQSHVTQDERDVTTMTSYTVHDASVVQDSTTATETSSSSRHAKQQSVAAARSRGRVTSRGQLGGFGRWSGGMDYFDFFDYIVDYQPQRRRPLAKHGGLKTRRHRQRPSSVDRPDRRSNRPARPASNVAARRSGGVEELDVVGRLYAVEVSDDQRDQELTQSLPASTTWLVRQRPRSTEQRPA